MLDHWSRLTTGIAPLEFSWVLLSFVEFSEFCGWVFLIFQVLKLLISTQKCSRHSSDTMLDHWGRLAIDIAPLEFCWVFLSFLEFSEFFCVFRDFRIPQTLFWVDSKLFFIGFGFYRAWSPYTAQARSGTPNYWFFGFPSLSFLSFLSFGAGWSSKISKKCIMSDGWFVLVMIFLIDSANLSVSDVLKFLV